MKNLLTYQETLDIVEKFMIESCIRYYCADLCKGKCCKGCYTSKEACHLNEGRRLPCSIYVCPLLLQFFPEKTIRLLCIVRNIVTGIYYDYNLNLNSCYFTVPSNSFLQNAKFPISIKHLINKTDIKAVKKIMNKIVKTWKNKYKQ